MKKLLLILIFSGYTSFYSQNLNSATHHAADEVGNMISIGANNYYFETDVYGCCSREMSVYGVSNTGQTLMSHTVGVTSGNWYFPKKLIRTRDKHMVLFGSVMTDCDVGGFNDFFIKLDTLGNKVFETDIPVPGNNASDVSDMVQYTDSSYYLATSTGILHYSKDGTFISNISTAVNHLVSIARLANGHLLICGQSNSVATLEEITPSAGMISQQPSSAGAVLKFIEADNGFLYGLTSSGTLARYNAALNLQNTSTLTVVNDFAVRNDSVFVTGVSASLPFYSVCNAGLGVLYNTQQAYYGLMPVSISLNRATVSILTQDVSSTAHAISFKGLYQMPVNGTFASVSDIGVSRSSINSYTLYASQATPGTLAVSAQYNLNVTVKNFGNDTVHDFCLSSYLYNIYCINIFHRSYTTTIAPHDSVVVQTGDIYEWPFYIPSNTPQSAQLPVQFCFFSTVPNASNDINIFNDSKCDSMFVPAIFTGIEKNTLHSTEISVSPNPFSRSFTVRSTAGIKQLSVYTLIGALQRDEAVNAREATVDLEALPAGLYFIKLDTEKGTVIKKVVKE